MKGFLVDLQFGKSLAGLPGVWAGRRKLRGGLYVIQVRNEAGWDEALLMGSGNRQRGNRQRGEAESWKPGPCILRGKEALRVRSPEVAWEMGGCC